MHRAVLGADDIPARLLSPRDTIVLLIEEFRHGHALCRPDDFLFGLRQVPTEIGSTVWAQPNAAVHNLDVREDRGLGELVLLALRGLSLVRCKGRDINQRGNPLIHPRMRDQSAAVRMANENHGTTDSSDAAYDRIDVNFQRVEAMLRTDHFMPVSLQRWNQLLKT